VRDSPTDHVARDDRVGATSTAPATQALTAWTRALTGSASQLSIASAGLRVRELASRMISSTSPANHSPGRDARGRRARAYLDYLVPDDFTQVGDWL
jgi:hypothetical protein